MFPWSLAILSQPDLGALLTAGKMLCQILSRKILSLTNSYSHVIQMITFLRPEQSFDFI